MNREYTADSMVRLPRASAQRAVALGSKILTVADSTTLPTPLEKYCESLRREATALSTELSPLLSATAQRPDATEADRRLDSAWRGIADILTGWKRLPEATPQAAKAHKLDALLFSDGLKFTLVDYNSEWAESQSRITALSEQSTAALVQELGLQPFVDEAAAAHRNYGEALGITKKLPVEERPEIKARLDSFTRALRVYVLQVAAYGASGEPQAEELAASLLAPVAEWR